MTELQSQNILKLSGHLTIEDVEPLMAQLEENGTISLDLAGVTHMHAAMAQLLAVKKCSIIACPEDAFSAQILRNLQDMANPHKS